MIQQINPADVVYSRKFQGLCKMPYGRNKEGCPNFGHKEGCPPGLPLINEIFDFNRELYVIYTAYDIQKYAQQMVKRHPEWAGTRMLYNSRFWQPAARKAQRAEEKKFLEEFIGTFVDRSPEGHGANITDLMSKIDIELEWNWPPTKQFTYRVSIGGYLK